MRTDWADGDAWNSAAVNELAIELNGKVAGVIYNVRYLGAVGNGTTDDLAAIQAAINAAQTAGGGIVYFPRGTYLVSGRPTITGSNIIVRGVGSGSKILLGSAALNAAGSTTGIWVNGGTNILIQDLAIDGNFANIAKNGSFHAASTIWTPIRTEYGASSVKNYVYAGSGIDAGTYLHDRLPIRITNANNVTVQNCELFNSISAGVLADGTSVNGCKNITVTGCRIHHCWDNGVYFHQGVQFGSAIDNVISDLTYNGVSAVYCDRIMVANNQIRKCGPSDSDSGGVQINGSSNCSVVDNMITECNYYGVGLLSTQETNITGGLGGNSAWAENAQVIGNTITDCHAADFPTHEAPGVSVFGAGFTHIADNTVDDCDFGIAVGTHATNTFVFGNRLIRALSCGITVGNSADVINTVIKGNHVAYNGSHGVFAYAPAHYEDNVFLANNGMGISLAEPPSGLPSKIDYVIGNTFCDNTDSGILTNGRGASLAYVVGNTFTNSYGVLFEDGGITNADATLTSATANFTSADVGLPVFLMNQGPNDTLTTTVIASINSATSVELAANAAATQTGIRFFIGRGPRMYVGSSSGATITAPAGTFKSSDAGKGLTVWSGDSDVSTLLYTGTIATYTSATVAEAGGALGTNASIIFIVNRSIGQQARAINNFNAYPVLNRENKFVGIPEILN